MLASAAALAAWAFYTHNPPKPRVPTGWSPVGITYILSCTHEDAVKCTYE